MIEQIMAVAERLGSAGDELTPELVQVASEAAGAEAAAAWLAEGRSTDDCGVVRRYYTHVGGKLAALFGPGGPYEGATLGAHDEVGGNDEDDSSDDPPIPVSRGRQSRGPGPGIGTFEAVGTCIAMIRDWFDPKVIRQADGSPAVWLWVTPVMGLLVTCDGDQWFVEAMGYGKRREPASMGIAPRAACPVSTSPPEVAKAVMFDVVHAFSTYSMLSREAQHRRFDSDWARKRMFDLAMDGWV